MQRSTFLHLFGTLAAGALCPATGLATVGSRSVAMRPWEQEHLSRFARKMTDGSEPGTGPYGLNDAQWNTIRPTSILSRSPDRLEYLNGWGTRVIFQEGVTYFLP